MKNKVKKKNKVKIKLNKSFLQLYPSRVFLLMLTAVLFVSLSTAVQLPVQAQPIISIDHHTNPTSPVKGEFILSIDLTNSGTSAKNLKIQIHEDESDLSILDGSRESSSAFAELGGLPTGSTSAQFRLKAEKEGIFELKGKVSYTYIVNNSSYTGSIDKTFAIIVLNDPRFSISEKLEIKPSQTKQFSVSITNQGGTAKDVSISLVTPDKIVSNVGKLVINEWISGETKDIEFSLTTDNSITEGVYELKFDMSYNNRFGEQKSDTITIGLKVAGSPILSISEIYTDPQRIYPESEFTLNVVLDNTGTGEARVTNLVLTIPDTFEGETSKFLGTIDRDSSKTAQFTLKASNNTPFGDHKFALKLEFVDRENNQHSDSKEFPVFISSLGRINLDIAGVFTSPDTPISGESFKLSLQVENSGSQDAKGVNLQLDFPEGFEGRKTYFIGTLESGDSATASFDIKASSSGNHDVKVVMNYLDSKFQPHTTTKSFTLYVSAADNSGILVGIIVLLAAVIVIIYYKLKK